MCEVLERHSPSADGFLESLCANITRVQRAEVAWLEAWLAARGHAVHAPCGLVHTCTGGANKTATQRVCASTGAPPFAVAGAPPLACEDTLPVTSFCHAPDGSLNEDYCTCERAAAAGHSCSGSPTTVGGSSAC